MRVCVCIYIYNISMYVCVCVCLFVFVLALVSIVSRAVLSTILFDRGHQNHVRGDVSQLRTRKVELCNLKARSSANSGPGTEGSGTEPYTYKP